MTTEFTARFNDKDITFTETGIRYDGKVFIRYTEMEDVTQRKGAEAALVFRYKGKLVKMAYDPADADTIAEIIEKAFRDPEKEIVEAPVIEDKYGYLDSTIEEADEENDEEKRPGKGLIIALIGAVAVIAIAIILLF